MGFPIPWKARVKVCEACYRDLPDTAPTVKKNPTGRCTWGTTRGRNYIGCENNTGKLAGRSSVSTTRSGNSAICAYCWNKDWLPKRRRRLVVLEKLLEEIQMSSEC